VWAVSDGRPRVGITWSTGSEEALAWYREAVAAAGGVPVVLRTGEVSPDDADAVDALVLAGGGDIHPHRYGQEVDPRVADTLEVDEARDAFELAVVARALDRDLPVLGICRGVQLLNVALGGTLVQDLSLLGVERARHNQRGRLPMWEAAHDVRVAGHSALRRLLGETVVPVNSFHHQAVDRPAPELAVVAEAFDGVVEAVEHPERRFLVGVQWHPERMVRHAPAQRRLFEALVAAATEARR